MKAAVLGEHGVEVRDLPVPEPKPNQVVIRVRASSLNRADLLVSLGIRREHIVLDPGFGFGKSFEENYPLLARFEQLQKIGLPLLSGPSRKSFIGRTLARNGNDAPPNQRLNGTIAAVVASVMKGAHIVRVHDVAPVVEALKVADAVLAAEQ